MRPIGIYLIMNAERILSYNLAVQYKFITFALENVVLEYSTTP